MLQISFLFQSVIVTIGCIFAGIGIVLYTKQFGKNENNEISIFSWSFKLTNSAILIFIAGIALIIVGYLYNPGEINPPESKQLGVSVPPAVDFRDLCSRPIQNSDLEGKSQSDLQIIRNTIFAMHGYIFYKNPDLIKYFSKQPWYHPRGDFNEEIDFSKMDKANVKLIQSFEHS